MKANILIDQTGNARLADFGLLTIVSDPENGLSSSSSMQGGTTRWMSPEMINPQKFGLEKCRPTESSDCYALGMVIYETISGHAPFHGDQHQMAVIAKVLGGQRPPREVSFTDSLWKLLESCWKPRSDARPTIEDVLKRLEAEPAFPGQRVEMEEDDDDWDTIQDDSSCTFSYFIHSAKSYGLRSYVGKDFVYEPSGSRNESDATSQ